jgi:hypothetical protein
MPDLGVVRLTWPRLNRPYDPKMPSDAFHLHLHSLFEIADKDLPVADESCAAAAQYLQSSVGAHDEAFEDRTAQNATAFDGDYAVATQGNPFLENSTPGGLYKELEQEFDTVRDQLSACLKTLASNLSLSAQAVREIARRYAAVDGQSKVG